MRLRIKEIFKSDLDPNSGHWWSNDKIDKLNYNFDKLKLGGPLGPIGDTGADGETGFMGAQGPQGHIGPFGPQGPRGIDGNYPWQRIQGPNNDTIFPFLLETEALSAADLGIALPVMFGTSELESVYPPELYSEGLNNTQLDTLNDSMGLVHLNGTVLTLSNRYKANQLLLKDDNHSLGFKFTGASTIIGGEHTSNFNIDLSTSRSVSYTVDNKTLLKVQDNDLGNESLRINANTTFKGSDKKLTTTDNFKYEFGSEGDQVLTNNSTGDKVIWKDRASVFGALPFGSIVPIPDNMFNDTLFELNPGFEYSGGLIKFEYGRGRVGGQFEGWYLCNGQTWRFDVIEHEVPNLSRHSHNIDSEGIQIQSQSPAQDNINIIVGNAAYSIDGAVPDGQTDYTVQSTLVDGDESVLVQYGGTSTHVLPISTQPYIINLVQNNLYWIKGEADLAQQSIIKVSRGDSQAIGTEDSACNATSFLDYSWTNSTNYTEWNDINNDLTGILMYDETGTAFAPTGWYSFDGDTLTNTPGTTDTGIIRYWSQVSTSFEQVSECVTQIELAYNSSVISLNGEMTTGIVYKIDEPLFIDATELKEFDGSSADAGWYKEAAATGSGHMWRRYWNGSSFVGESIIEDYVYEFDESNDGVIYASNVFGNSSCDADNLIQTPSKKSFFATNALIIIDHSLSNLKSIGAVVYVNKDWQANPTTQIGAPPAIGHRPLVKWSNQFGYNQSYSYSVISQSKIGASSYAAVNQGDSTIGTIVDCILLNSATTSFLEHPDTSAGTNQKITMYTPGWVRVAVNVMTSGDRCTGQLSVVGKGTSLATAGTAAPTVNDPTYGEFGDPTGGSISPSYGGGGSLTLSTDTEYGAEIYISTPGEYDYSLTASYIIGQSGTVEIQFGTENADGSINWTFGLQ